MKNLDHILTEDLVLMLEKLTEDHLELTKQVIQSGLDITELKKLIELRKLPGTILPSVDRTLPNK